MLLYSKYIVDPKSCTHSIDNLVVEYVVKSFRTETVLDELSKIFADTIPGWERDKNCKERLPACTKYQFFRSAIWGGGYSIQYGHYQDFDKLTREWTEYPLLRVKFNPNKWMNSPVFARLIAWLDAWCDNGVIVKFDYAVDVPARLSDIQVYSRKEPGLYKGTRYYGQRNKHGRLKIYDKEEESNLDVVTSRVEWTFCLNKPIVFDDVMWITNGPAPLPDVTELGSQSYSLARMILTIRSLGGDPREALSLLDYRTQKKLEPYTIGTGVQLFDCGVEYLTELLYYYCLTLSVSFSADGVNAISIGNNFRRLSADDLESDELPF